MKSSQIELVIFFLIVLCNFFLCHYRYCMLSIYLFISFTRLVFWRQGPCHSPIAFPSPWFSDWHKDIQYILTEQMNECWETIPICISSWWQLNEFPQNSVTQQLNTKNVYHVTFSVCPKSEFGLLSPVAEVKGWSGLWSYLKAWIRKELLLSSPWFLTGFISLWAVWLSVWVSHSLWAEDSPQIPY